MSVLIQGDELSTLLLGRMVERASAVVPASTVSTPYFTVSGGMVLVTSLVGVCTAAGDATATTLLFSAVPTVGAANNMCGASASNALAIIGQIVSVDGAAITTAMQASSVTTSGNIGGMSKPIVVAVGTINMVTANTNATLAYRWMLRYLPLEKGAAVVAA